MTNKLPQPNSGINDIAIYVPGKSAAPEGVRLFKLSSNESPVGPSQRALDAYAQAAGHLEDYPDGSASELREAIGEVPTDLSKWWTRIQNESDAGKREMVQALPSPKPRRGGRRRRPRKPKSSNQT